MADEFEEVVIARRDAPDVRFRGKLIAATDTKADTRQERRDKKRWTRIALWELQSGDWIAASVGCSVVEGESELGDVKRIQSIEEQVGRDPPQWRPTSNEPWWLAEKKKVGVEVRQREHAAMRREAMEFWRYSWLAKALAVREGWDATEEWA